MSPFSNQGKNTSFWQMRKVTTKSKSSTNKSSCCVNKCLRTIAGTFKATSIPVLGAETFIAPIEAHLDELHAKARYTGCVLARRLIEAHGYGMQSNSQQTGTTQTRLRTCIMINPRRSKRRLGQKACSMSFENPISLFFFLPASYSHTF